MRLSILLSLAGLLAFLAVPASALDPAPRAIAAGIYILAGEATAPSPGNGGRVANVGLVIGPEGVVVIGTGASDADGEAILAAIARLTGKPVVLAINTYAGSEHVLGNGAFARRGIPILAHRATDEYMAANCTACLGNVLKLTGAAPMADFRPERPRRLVDGPVSLLAGGRPLEILHYGPTQQPGSIAIFDPTAGILFAGGLASFELVPDARDGDLEAWIAALEEMERLPLQAVVPARGTVGDGAGLAKMRAYLADLSRQTRQSYAAGLSLFEAVEAAGLPAYGGWALYPQAHRRNVHFQYLRLEARDFAEMPAK